MTFCSFFLVLFALAQDHCRGDNVYKGRNMAQPNLRFLPGTFLVNPPDAAYSIMKKNAARLLLILGIGLSACTPPATPTPTTTAPAIAIATFSPTQTPLPPSILIHQEMDCLANPKEAGEPVATFHNGDLVSVAGKDDYGEYWVVIDPISGTGCWIPREGTSSQGIIDYLPNLVPPPTSKPRKPAAPGNFKAVMENCARGPNAEKEWIPVVLLSWEDLSDNEASFLIYRYGQLIEYTARDETRFRDAFTVRSNGEVKVTYSISSFSRSGGESDQIEVELHFFCK